MRAFLAVVLLTAAAQGWGQRSISKTSEEPIRTAGGDHPLRLRLGVLGGMAMQKTDLELAGGYDVAKLTDRLRLAADLTVGLGPTEVTLESMAGVRLPFVLRSVRALEPYLEGLAGVSLTFLRGSVALAIPIRVGAGLSYTVAPGVALGLTFGVEVGPLVAPFADTYAALHAGALVSWAL